ncbi:hypothetical protein GLOIN_2v1788498 [Rhizophagus irregularis DAOM 181602=DAOM 197198]|nr:hypothetical protein GLOIN_2v1788498 [Rhizophagus irregularis DAOM 181602=DAOM 197198]
MVADFTLAPWSSTGWKRCGRFNGGAAFIETHSNTQIGACIQDWPSTRAELMGIFLALLVSPPNSIIHIYTDSQSAIHSINNVLQHKNARRLDLDSSYDNRFTHGSNEFRFMPQYNRTSIEQNIRKFIHKALHFRNYGAWSRVLLINDSITIGTQLGLPSNKSSFLNVLPPNATAFDVNASSNGNNNITVQDKRISIHNRSSRTRRADRPVITEDEIIVLDGPDPTTQPIYAPVYNSPRQSFQDSLGLMHSQLQKVPFIASGL